jgi:hypothetical protein
MLYAVLMHQLFFSHAMRDVKREKDECRAACALSRIAQCFIRPVNEKPVSGISLSDVSANVH